jgi:hypothetical protein
MAGLRNPRSGSTDDTSNITLLTEDDFSVVPENTYIWDGELPFKEGDTFPTPFIQERANVFKTNRELYRNRFDGIFDMLFTANDFLQDPITNQQITRLMPNLPDYRIVTDTWVDLLAAKPPKIDGGDTNLISRVSSIVGMSNFPTAYQSIIRESLIMYGNSVVRVDRQSGGNPKIVPMPLKTWIPFVNENDLTAIDVNCFFNIFKDKESGNELCEFILYHEDGKVEKITFEYSSSARTLGKELDREDGQAFGGKGVSPIVVFAGSTLGNTVYGEDAYKAWEAAIASSIRAYGAILKLIERAMEIYRVLPEGASQRDEQTGITYVARTGVVLYRKLSEGAPEVKVVVPEVRMAEVISAYKETLVRLSRDTGLSYAIFDTKELGTQMSAKALKTTMYRTELSAKSKSTTILMSTKMLIMKLALAGGVEIGVSDFALLTESGFVQDIETLTDLVQKRNGGAVTLGVEDSISRLDDLPMSEAMASARALRGEPQVDNTEESSTTDSGGDSDVSEVSLTHGSTADDSANKGTQSGLTYYPMGGGNIGG